MSAHAVVFAVHAFVRGNVHVHTSASDGDAPAAAVAGWYASRGYGFLSITDHDLLTSTAAPPGLTLIPGVEVSSWSRSEKKAVHVNALCASSPASGVRDALAVSSLLSATITRARQAGGLVLVNHPTFGAAVTEADLLRAQPFDLLEIASAHPLVPRGPAEAMWDALLTAGREVKAVAVDDAHDFLSAGEGRAPGGAWIEAWDVDASSASVCAALREGKFYASAGARLERLSVDRGVELSVAGFDPATDAVEFVGAGGRVLARRTSSPARYAAAGGEGYIRARVLQSGGRAAWTQAYRFP